MAEGEGQRFGKYLLIDRLAAGGMAEIYRAKYMAAAGVTKSVVIKRIHPHHAGNRDFVSMFINEAQIAVGLAHGNIAQVFDFGELDGEYYLAMEYVHGLSVSQLRKKARAIGLQIPLPIAVFVVSEICAGLDYAHSRTDEQGRPLGIVHRDVSPQNIIVSYEGQVKLVDFGIAKARLESRDETAHGMVKGKYLYFSPEQARSMPLDGRSDVFAAGICLYELLTGRLPFDGQMLDVMGRIVRGEFDPPSLHNPDITPALEQIVLKAMALRPEDRYQTALELNEALVQHLHTTWPRFSRNHVAHLAQYLGREELEQDGVKVNLPEEFQTLISEWLSASASRAATAAHVLPPVDIELDDEDLEDATEALEPLEPEQPAAASRSRPWRIAAIAAGVLMVAALAAGLGRTLLEPSDPVAVREEQAPPPVPAAEPPPPDGPTPPTSTPDRPLQIDAREGAINVLASHAARIRLDPARRYEIVVEGTALLPGPDGERLTMRSAFYFAERTRGTQAEGSFGLLAPGDSVVLSGARALYGFIVDDAPQENGGALKLHITDVRAGTSAELLVDPAIHVLRPDELGLPRFVGLDPERSYWLSLSGAADLGAGGGEVSSAIFYRRGGPGSKARSQGMVTADTPVKVSDASEVLLLLPDDDQMDNAGVVSARLEVAAE